MTIILVLLTLNQSAGPFFLLRFFSRVGEVSEWFKERHWKCRVGFALPRVRIPPSPFLLFLILYFVFIRIGLILNTIAQRICVGGPDWRHFVEAASKD